MKQKNRPTQHQKWISNAQKVSCGGICTISALVSCESIPEPPDPPRLVNDLARIFTERQVDSLENVLVDFDTRTSNQICFVSVKTLAGMEVDDFGLQLANKWGIGTKEHQNGVLVLIKPRGFDNDYIDVTIQVGRGLEGAIPDAYASRIIRNVMGPYLKRDQYWPAVVKACDNLMGLASGEISKPRTENSIKQELSRIKQDIKSGFHKAFDDIWMLAIFIPVVGLIALIIYWLEKWNEKKQKAQKKGKKKKAPAATTVIKDVDDSDDDNDSGHFFTLPHSHDQTDNGGFGGFGGGGFGGGGASGRF